jgi:hypothetical protein
MPTICSSLSAIPSAPTHRRVPSRVALLALVAALTIVGLVVAWRAPDAAAVEMPAVNDRVLAIAPDGAGGVYIGGMFTQVGTSARSKAAHILADGTVDPAWNPGPASGYVTALAVYGTTVYMGGTFLTVGGADRPRLASVDATGAVSSWAPSPNAPVYALALSGSTLYIGGSFTGLNGPGVTRFKLAAVDVTSGNVTAWDPWPVGPGARVDAIAVAGSTVYLGGQFATVGGVSGFNNLARVGTGGTGTADPSWQPSVNYGTMNCSDVYGFAVSTDTLYLGGCFGQVDGQTRLNAAAFDLANGSLRPWNPTLNDEVRTIRVVDSTVYLGGGFEQVNGAAHSYAVAIGEDGAIEAWDPGVTDYVFSMASIGSTIFVGGDAGLAAVAGVAPAPTPDPTPTPTPTPTSTPTATIGPAVVEPAPFSPAPGITVGETRGEAVLAAAVPAAGADLLRGANIWVRPTSKVEYLASSLPDGLKLVDGKLVASKPGTYKVKMKVKRANGTSVVRAIKIKVG